MRGLYLRDVIYDFLVGEVSYCFIMQPCVEHVGSKVTAFDRVSVNKETQKVLQEVSVIELLTFTLILKHFLSKS